jgi:hypothetical protein
MDRQSRFERDGLRMVCLGARAPRPDNDRSNMSNRSYCPHCGQPLPEIRLGVRLTPLKARIFDLVQRGGRDGIDRSDLFDIVFGGTGRCRGTLKSHIVQINGLIADEGYRISGRLVARLEKL